MYYRRDLDYTYPENSAHHMLKLKRMYKIELNENYKYVPRSVWSRISRALVAPLTRFMVFS